MSALLSFAAVVFFFDQLTKRLVRTRVAVPFCARLLRILRRQCVLDFIDLGWQPVFNFADVSIVGGLILAFRA